MTSDPVHTVISIRKDAENIRRRLQELDPELATSSSEAVNIARQDLCKALVRRLQIAEQELLELEGMFTAKA
jgi:hypothetical protein